jgi:hypothetical protein
MTSILVWYLVSMSNGSSNWGNVHYSPPLASLEDCQRLQQFVDRRYWTITECIQVKKVNEK